MSFPYPSQCTPCFVFAVSCMKSEYAHFLSGPRNNLIIADIFAFFLAGFVHSIILFCIFAKRMESCHSSHAFRYEKNCFSRFINHVYDDGSKDT